VDEVTPVPVGTEPERVERPAQLGLVLGVSRQRSQLVQTVRKLTLLAILARRKLLKRPGIIIFIIISSPWLLISKSLNISYLQSSVLYREEGSCFCCCCCFMVAAAAAISPCCCDGDEFISKFWRLFGELLLLLALLS
jgi:hypothetical protein